MFGGLDSSGRYEQEATEYRGCQKEGDDPESGFIWKDGK